LAADRDGFGRDVLVRPGPDHWAVNHVAVIYAVIH
jgi:hypothetical protein